MAHRWILQFCHSHYGPFTDVARQYAALFQGTDFKVLTVYLTGESSESVREGSASDEVVFILAMSTGARIHARVGGLKAEGISQWNGLR